MTEWPGVLKLNCVQMEVMFSHFTPTADPGCVSLEVIKGNLHPKTLAMGEGALVLFRGRNSLHRVVPVSSERSRILVTLNFNTEPNVMLSELARLAFFGRLK